MMQPFMPDLQQLGLHAMSPLQAAPLQGASPLQAAGPAGLPAACCAGALAGSAVCPTGTMPAMWAPSSLPAQLAQAPQPGAALASGPAVPAAFRRAPPAAGPAGGASF